ncbi:MAG: hypothetical protein ACHREM_04765 [Polyangiales bacterium]
MRDALQKGGQVFDISSICQTDNGAAIIIASNGSVELTMWNEGGYNSTSVNLSDLVDLLRDTPELASLVATRNDGAPKPKVPLTNEQVFRFHTMMRESAYDRADRITKKIGESVTVFSDTAVVIHSIVQFEIAETPDIVLGIYNSWVKEMGLDLTERYTSPGAGLSQGLALVGEIGSKSFTPAPGSTPARDRKDPS